MAVKTVPLKYQIADKIKTLIKNEDLKPDDKIPSEAELCKKYNVSRTTVIAALQLLQNESYIYRNQGKGTFVASKRFVRDYSPDNTIFNNMVTQQPLDYSSQILQIKTVLADEMVANSLEIEAGEKVVYLERLRLIDGKPVAITWTYLAWKYGQKLLLTPLDEKFSIYKYIREEYLQEPVQGPLLFVVDELNSHESKLLDAQEGTVCCKTVSCSFLANKPFEYAHTVMLASKFEFRINNNGSSAFFVLKED